MERKHRITFELKTKMQQKWFLVRSPKSKKCSLEFVQPVWLSVIKLSKEQIELKFETQIQIGPQMVQMAVGANPIQNSTKIRIKVGTFAFFVILSKLTLTILSLLCAFLVKLYFLQYQYQSKKQSPKTISGTSKCILEHLYCRLDSWAAIEISCGGIEVIFSTLLYRNQEI